MGGGRHWPRRLGLGLVAWLLGHLIAPLLVPAHAASAGETPVTTPRAFPRTLAEDRALGPVSGPTAVVAPDFAIDFLVVSWTSGDRPSVRFLANDEWSAWSTVELDELPTTGGRTFSRLIAAGGADAYQVRGAARSVRAVAINTTDGPRVETTVASGAFDIAQPPVISRAGWGADESLRFDSSGEEIWPPAFYRTQKLIVHHTVTVNNDPDPEATVRAIYFDHAVVRGFGDIGYNFLIDAEGRIYKGRYSGPPGTRNEDTLTGENAAGHGVTGAHVGGFNSGTMGIAILGDFVSSPVPAASRAALLDHLAWESRRHRLDPVGSSTYVNPVSGEEKDIGNISGHLDWAPTACPGAVLYADLPAIRQDVAGMVLHTDVLVSPAFQTQRRFPVSWEATGGAVLFDVRSQAAPHDRGFGPWTLWKSDVAGSGRGFRGRPGHTYCFQARGKDGEGTVARWSAKDCTSVPVNDRRLTADGSWAEKSAATAYLGTYSQSKHRGDRLILAKIRAKRLSLLVTKCPRCGKVRVFFKGNLLKTIRLAAPSLDRLVVVPLKTYRRVKRGTLIVRVTSGSGKLVRVEGLGVSRA